MKKEYTIPEVEIKKFHTSQVITGSINIGDVNGSDSGLDWSDIT